MIATTISPRPQMTFDELHGALISAGKPIQEVFPNGVDMIPTLSPYSGDLEYGIVGFGLHDSANSPLKYFNMDYVSLQPGYLVYVEQSFISQLTIGKPNAIGVINSPPYLEVLDSKLDELSIVGNAVHVEIYAEQYYNPDSTFPATEIKNIRLANADIDIGFFSGLSTGEAVDYIIPVPRITNEGKSEVGVYKYTNNEKLYEAFCAVGGIGCYYFNDDYVRSGEKTGTIGDTESHTNEESKTVTARFSRTKLRSDSRSILDSASKTKTKTKEGSQSPVDSDTATPDRSRTFSNSNILAGHKNTPLPPIRSSTNQISNGSGKITISEAEKAGIAVGSAAFLGLLVSGIYGAMRWFRSGKKKNMSSEVEDDSQLTAHDATTTVVEVDSAEEMKSTEAESSSIISSSKEDETQTSLNDSGSEVTDNNTVGEVGSNTAHEIVMMQPSINNPLSKANEQIKDYTEIDMDSDLEGDEIDKDKPKEDKPSSTVFPAVAKKVQAPSSIFKQGSEEYYSEMKEEQSKQSRIKRDLMKRKNKAQQILDLYDEKGVSGEREQKIYKQWLQTREDIQQRIDEAKQKMEEAQKGIEENQRKRDSLARKGRKENQR